MIPRISLEQWAAFKAVVDEGSFAKAAEALNKSQSTVSYALSKMEERLPSTLFIQEGRKAELTEFGQAMYRHAENLLKQALMIDQSAQYLASGWEPEVIIAVDAIASMDSIFCALQSFSLEHPLTRIRMLETTLSGTEEVLLRREADLAILGRVPPGFLYDSLGSVNKIPVAAATHPLGEESKPISEDFLKQYRQIVIRDSGAKRTVDSGWLESEQRWTVSHFATSIAAIKAGLGFGFIPREKIMKELASGELKELNLLTGSAQTIPLYLVMSAQSHAGLATKAVREYLLKYQ